MKQFLFYLRFRWAQPLVMLLLMSMVMVGCLREYEFNRAVVPQVVVNSILNPDSLIRVDLWWSKQIDGSKNYARVVNATVKIEEDGVVIFTATSRNEQIVCDYRPRCGARYSISVEHPEQAEVTTANTVVPNRPTGDCAYMGSQPNDVNDENRYFTITSAVIESTATALMITAEHGFDTLTPHDAIWPNYMMEVRESSLQTTIPFADQFNCIRDEYMAKTKGSIFYFPEFVRIIGDNVGRAMPITMSVYRGFSSGFYPLDWWFYPELYPEGYRGVQVEARHRITLSAASDDYDRYCKSLYVFITNNNAEGSNVLKNQTHRVYSNVQNGLGIFAARADLVFIFNFK